MAVILSHGTALQVVRRGGVLAPESPDDRLATQPTPRGEYGQRAKEVRAVRQALELAGLLDEEQTMDVLTCREQPRSRCKTVRSRRWTAPRDLPVRRLLLPTLSEADVRIYVVAPEVLFVEGAQRLGLAATALLGWELCGRYGKVLPGDRRQKLVERGFSNRKALTSATKLRAFLDSVPQGLSGTKLARVAVALVMDGARSPMEAAVTLLLIAPPELGGLGFPPPLVNHRLPLSPRLTALTNEPWLEVDLLWERPGTSPFIIEIDGYRSHRGSLSPAQAARDALKQNELVRRNATVLRLAGTEITDPDRFLLNSQNIADELGVPMPAQDEKWRQAFGALHAEAMNRELLPPANPEDLAGMSVYADLAS